MPNVNAKVAGDNFYPKYSVPHTAPVSAIAITKGRLYTKGGATATGNQLVAVTATGFINGIYQATETIATAGGAGDHTMQCWTVRSRIGLPAKVANMHAGMKVKYDITNHKAEAWTGSSGGVTPNELNNCIGTILEIYSKTDITKRKDITAADDIVIIDLGVAV